MIATNEAVDVLRHGWQDAASTLAADVPEVAELLQARLEMAVSTGRLDERNLLDTIQEVESITSRAGSPSSQALARRLRRTVYEYLLALDAARPSETARASVEQPATASDGPLVGAEEVAALGHASATRAVEPAAELESSAEAVSVTTPVIEPPRETAPTPDASAADEGETTADPQTEAQAPPRRLALRRRQRLGADPDASDTPDGELVAVEDAEAQTAEPEWQYSPAGDPAVFESDLGAPAIPEAPASAAPTKVAAEAQPADAEAMTGETAPGEGIATSAPGFVAPRAGFHIVEDAPAHRVAAPDEARLEMPTFTADEPAPEQEQPPLGDADRTDQGSQFLAWHGTGTPEGAAADAAPSQPDAAAAPATPDPLPSQVVDTAPQADVVQTSEGDDSVESRGWGVRRPGEAHSSRRHAVSAPPIEDDPFESNSRLADIRRRIEDRLRKKRCDEAAALLQELAQEAGGRAVAELAMNAGDRCRALGKSNAALNCYLAAARSDPVYELPLSRLADICIDDQDTELAVSYLERIARLYRYRGDDRAAIRMYRRIATVAPYRDDVLGLLMNAQRTGRLE